MMTPLDLFLYGAAIAGIIFLVIFAAAAAIALGDVLNEPHDDHKPGD